ncbi:MAG: family 16 glycosylhydrolase, partial [Massilibacteroides sp.]|nr:family 16 glycosylhydrolase [Massilibacteroides sp.]
SLFLKNKFIGMKNKLFLFLFLPLVTAFIGCGSSNGPGEIPPITTLSVSPEAVSLTAEGTAVSINVSTTHEWGTAVSDSWIKVTPSNAVKDAVVTIAADPNVDTNPRTGTVTFMAGSARKIVTVEQAAAKETTSYVPAGYKMVWNDEFNEGTDLDPSNWTHEVQRSGWVNNELQNYIKGSFDGKPVTEIKDGRLNINCFKGSDGKIYSGRVYAKVNTGWLYGYFEARILLPKGKGTWPAFWMMPANNNFSTNPWPDCGEIDIMEEVGAVPNEVSSSIHCKAYNHMIGTQKTQKLNIGTAESEYHTYGCEWTDQVIRFYVDGKLLLSFPNEGKGKDTWPFYYAFYPILNLAWGGSWGGMNGVDESALPLTMKVDYIRVFQKK